MPDGPEPASDEVAPAGEMPEHRWKPPERSDQAPGEEVVQVNDAYAGDGPPPSEESQEDDQHPTGG